MTFPDDSSEEAEESAEPVSEESYEESHCSEADESSSGEPSEEQSLPEESSMTEESSAPEESSMTEESSVPEESSGQEVDESVFGLITVIGKGKNVRALEVFPGLEYLENACVSYARRIDAFTEKSGVNVYSMVIPKSCAFYLGGSKNTVIFRKTASKSIIVLKSFLQKQPMSTHTMPWKRTRMRRYMPVPIFIGRDSGHITPALSLQKLPGSTTRRKMLIP